MADRPRLITPVVHVLMRDGAQHDVQCENVDMLAYDLTRGPRKWPLPNEAPIIYQTFLAWKACTREGLIDPKTPWEVFTRDAVQITTTRPDPDDPDADSGPVEDTVDVDPSRPGPGPG